jgi:asparagine synthase (glutamine-hydrolysing)
VCGISCVFDCNIAESLVRRMLLAIHYRGEGPDEVWSSGLASMGARRLAIVGRPSGRQPIWSENASLAIVFNGEIYNYNELRASLTRLGHTFCSDSDTEVILHAFEEFGIDGIHRLDGMFCFVVWNKITNEYVAVRDRYGVKPLYYTRKDSAWLIASEAKSLISVSDAPIHELPPGHLLTHLGSRSWYVMPQTEISDDYETAKQTVRDLVLRAVRKRVLTDLPVAVFLSGGVDSSIVLLAAQRFHPHVTAITIGMPGASDIKAAERVCKDLGVELSIVSTDLPELLNCIGPVVYHTESCEPNMVRAGVFSYLLARRAQDLGFKIAICGEGADEIFGGYGDFAFCGCARDFRAMTTMFLGDLYRTQLQRVDRLGMAYTVEVREPYMDAEVVEYAALLDPAYKIRSDLHGKPITKFILRDAFASELPMDIVWREKVTLMKGAGLGDVSSKSNLFFNYAEACVSDEQLHRMRRLFGEDRVSTREEALYCSILYGHFGDRLLPAISRPTTARIELLET